MMKEWIEAFFYFLEKSAPFFQEFIKDELPSLSPYIELLKYIVQLTTYVVTTSTMLSEWIGTQI